VQIIKLEHEGGGAVLRKVRPWQAVEVGKQMVEELIKRFSVKTEEAMRVAAEVLGLDVEEVRRALVDVDFEFPRISEPKLGEWDEWDPYYGYVRVTSLPVACRMCSTELAGGERRALLLCSAGADSKLAAYSNFYSNEWICIGDRDCVKVAKNEVRQRGLRVSCYDVNAEAKAVNARKYRALYVGIIGGPKLYLVEVGGDVIKFAINSIDDLDSLKFEGDKRRAALSAIKHTAYPFIAI